MNLASMMKVPLPLLILLFISTTVCAQSAGISDLNLSFEEGWNGAPAAWRSHGTTDLGSRDYKYKVYLDSLQVKSGKFSAVIENQDDNPGFTTLSIVLPENYNGKVIRLTGYIKTENVEKGYGGLMMRIDPQGAFDNMNDRGVAGTSDWRACEITLPLSPRQTDHIIISAMLVGKGKMWIDDLQVFIDGKPLGHPDIEVYEPKFFPAGRDTAFDRGSNIEFPELEPEVLDNLELLGKIWGFLKYHHPEIAKGNYHWDYELFRILPDYLAAKSISDRDKVLHAWIMKYGPLLPCEGCLPVSKDAPLKPDLSWVDQSNLSNALKSLLRGVYNNRNQGENYYIAMKAGIGNPDFTHENAYADMPYPDPGFRLLSLYRYWNMIEYFFPYKHLTDKKWSGVLKAYILPFLQAENELEYELAALQLIGEIHDTHANLWGGGDKIAELKGPYFAPFRAGFVEGKLVVTDYYNPEFSAESRLKVGDIITHINGKKVDSIIDSLKVYYPASNKAARHRDMSADLLRAPQKTMTLRFTSEGHSHQGEIQLYERKELNMYYGHKVDKSNKCFEMLEGNIGYITLATIQQGDIPEIKKAFQNANGIIIDIRNYPSTFVPFTLGSYFVSEPTAFVKITTGDLNHPGAFTFRPGPEIKSKNNHYTGKVVVLVNEISQSQAEYTAMAFRAGANTSIIGSTTAGADGNFSTIFLPGGLRTGISGIGVYYPDGTETQRVGIVPDIVVKPTIAGIKSGRDEVLEKAIAIIEQSTSSSLEE